MEKMRNFARAFAKVSQDVWPGLYYSCCLGTSSMFFVGKKK